MIEFFDWPVSSMGKLPPAGDCVACPGAFVIKPPFWHDNCLAMLNSYLLYLKSYKSPVDNFSEEKKL
jgi:hypothetical protein